MKEEGAHGEAVAGGHAGGPGRAGGGLGGGGRHGGGARAPGQESLDGAALDTVTCRLRNSRTFVRFLFVNILNGHLFTPREFL